MSATARKLEQNGTKLRKARSNYQKKINVLLQKLGNQWYTFFELNGEIYYQVHQQEA